MLIKKIQIENFRLLKSFTIDLENDLSLIIGKNNTGKTSVLAVLDKFLNTSDKKRITIDDFNVDLKKILVDYIEENIDAGSEQEYIPLGIGVKVFIEYDEVDDLSQVNSLIMSLSPEDKNIVLSLEYKINYQNLEGMKQAYQATKEKYNEDASLFLKEHHSEYFGPIGKKSLLFDDEAVYTDLVKEGINLRDVLSFKYVSAKRSVTNKDSDKTLSVQTSRIYKRTSETKEQEEAVEEFKKKLRETDHELSGIYGGIFSELLEKVKKFGGIRKNDTAVKIASTLQHKEILEGNTTVLYSQDNHDLPEHYNGLGYMNLISMIFEIELLLGEFRRSPKEKPAAINLLFIEEPEAHTHPQMQYIFINNIKTLLKESRKREDGLEIQLQTVVSTHSSHIVSECDFDDIKYLKKDDVINSVESKNLKDLKNEYSSGNEEEDAIYKKHFKFLKQYLTLNRSELFFADKAVLIEGDTERLLLPAMMKKIDQEMVGDDTVIPMLSQNISVVEVGAHSQTFEKFINFIGVKTLIITDIDSYYDEPQFKEDGKTPKTYKNGNQIVKQIGCSPIDKKAEKTSNSSLLYFFGKEKENLDYFVNLQVNQKILAKKDGEWQPNEAGNLLICYQTTEHDYCGRSFEDAFFHINKDFLGDDSELFPSLTKKWFEDYVNNKPDVDALVFAEKAVGSKPSLAVEILLNSKTEDNVEFSNWKIPSYIKEGLEWLCKE